MLDILKDKLRSEMGVWEDDSVKNEYINNMITDFVDSLQALQDDEPGKAIHIMKYLRQSIYDLENELDRILWED